MDDLQRSEYPAMLVSSTNCLVCRRVLVRRIAAGVTTTIPNQCLLINSFGGI